MGKGPNSRSIMIGAVFGGLAFTLGLLPLSFPFPPLPYLRLDIAEIPSFIAMLMFGPAVGLISATSHFIALLMFGEWTPIGPLMKFMAVSSSLLGFWAAAHLTTGMGTRVCSFSLALLGAAARIIVMTLANYVLLTALFPFFLDLGAKYLSSFLGISLSTAGEKLFFVLLFTAIYNALHIPFSMIPALLLTRSLAPISPRLGSPSPWIITVAQSKRN
ncbi:Riboflavin transporter FmnP [Candidatus Calditenuaceae archaeon HR02]|nr:Riboflavin transporter FmnP [Candidatus Calditenuaceae archaeon HR02]